MVDLGGYVIIIVETKDKKIKLYGMYIFYVSLVISECSICHQFLFMHDLLQTTNSQCFFVGCLLNFPTK